MTQLNSFERVVAAFRDAGLNVKDHGRDQVVAQGPGHSNRDLSVLITYNGDQTLIYSYAGDDLANILEGVGLQTRDLFDDTRGVEYKYGDGRIVRRTVDKNFFQAGNKSGDQLFRTQFDGSRPIWVAGGEKDVRTLEHFGHQATTNAGGEGNVGNFDLSPLHGSDVVVIRDLDDTGVKFADILVEKLAGRARSLRVVTAAAGKDASDHIAAGKSVEDFVPDYAYDTKVAIKETIAKLERLESAPIAAVADFLGAQGAKYAPGDNDEAESSLKAFDHSMVDWLEWLYATDTDGDTIPLPWEDMNDPLAGGFLKGRSYLVAARPGAGKSLTLTNFAIHAATNGYRGALYSVEMGSNEVVSRIVAASTNARYGDITKRDIIRLQGDGTIDRIDDWYAKNQGLPLWISDKETLTLKQLRREVRDLQQSQGLDFVAVDYLQLLAGSRSSMSEQERLQEISRGLKVLSKELGVVVVSAAQLNREAAKGEAPMTKDLRGSGTLEQDSDVVILMHHEGDKDNPTGEVKMILGKNRTGPTMTIGLEWRPHQAKIGHWGDFDGERPRKTLTTDGEFSPNWASQR